MPHPVDVRVGRRVRELRAAQGLSQGALADKLGVSFQQVQKYEKGTNRMGASRLSDIARVLGVDIAELFQEEGKPSTRIEVSRVVLNRARTLESIADPALKAGILNMIQSATKCGAAAGGD